MSGAPRLSRRRFLQGALVGGAGWIAGSFVLKGCTPTRYAERDLRFLTAKEWATLEAASTRLLPPTPGRLGARDLAVADAADRLFSGANPRLQHDLKQLLNSLEDMTWLNLRFEPFTTLSAETQDAYLKSWQSSPLGLQRQGFVALAKITAMLAYMNPRSWPQIRYPGPWVGRLNLGTGLDNQADMPANPNPHVFERLPS